MTIVFARFLLVGGTATLIHYLILFCLVRFAGLNEVLASTLGYSFSAAWNYLLNRSFTFRSDRAHKQALPRFMVVALVGLLINALVVWACLAVLGFPLIAGQLLATFCALFWNFIANKVWSFAAPSQQFK